MNIKTKLPIFSIYILKKKHQALEYFSQVKIAPLLRRESRVQVL